MKVKHTAHRSAKMVGKVEDVRTDYAERLIASGFAVPVDDGEAITAPAENPSADVIPANDAASTAPERTAGRRKPAKPVDAGAGE